MSKNQKYKEKFVALGARAVYQVHEKHKAQQNCFPTYLSNPTHLIGAW